MALIKCNECGKEISDKATTCIHCGYPIIIPITDEENLELKNYEFIKNNLEKNNFFKSKTILECQKELQISQEEIKIIIEQILQEKKEDDETKKREMILKELAEQCIQDAIPKCPTCGSTISEELFREILIKEDEQRRREEVNQVRMKTHISVENRQSQIAVAKCPTCSSTDIEKIGTVGKIASVSVLGLASSNIGKTFKCNSCGYKW